jgi:hypothetical protein
MPLPLLGPILAALAGLGLAAAVIAYLKWDDILRWFRERENLKLKDKDAVAFTLQEALKNGRYKTVQGVFNTRTNKVVDARVVESKDVADELKEAHEDEQLAIYT